MNQQDLNAMTEFWHRETNRLNDSTNSAFKSAQDHSYAIGYRRGREDLIAIRKQLDELLSASERQFMADHVLINMPHDCTKHEHETALDEHTNAHYELRKAIATAKGNAA